MVFRTLPNTQSTQKKAKKRLMQRKAILLVKVETTKAQNPIKSLESTLRASMRNTIEKGVSSQKKDLVDLKKERILKQDKPKETQLL